MKIGRFVLGLCALSFFADHAYAADLAPETKAQLKKISEMLPDLRDRIATLEKENQALRSAIPSGAVVAFARGERGGGACPKGWSLFREAGGRMIVGAGQHNNAGLRAYPSYMDNPQKAVGGEEEVELTIEQMPRHGHDYDDPEHTHLARWIGSTSSGNSLGFGGIRGNLGDKGTGKSKTNIVIKPSGGGQSHNNMPPYIALYYCKKD